MSTFHAWWWRKDALRERSKRRHPQAAVERLAHRLHRDGPDSGYVVAVGDVVTSVSEVRGVLLAAMQVADAAARLGERGLYYRLPDLRLRGLLQLMRDNARLQSFAEREPGAAPAPAARR
ncbi:hypothetical protein ACIPSE_34250 [Streptomyces sp. NPDC090106]|uniref:hypothetical protein n=1 Tax=Streptomyces sp. NPDC090106 TaxID=3365946 RepID=UPI00382F8840